MREVQGRKGTSGIQDPASATCETEEVCEGGGGGLALGRPGLPCGPRKHCVLSEPLSSTQRKREATMTRQGWDRPGGLCSPQ